MRLSSLSVAVLMAVISAGSIQAKVAGTGPAGVEPSSARAPANPPDTVLSPNEVPRDPNSRGHAAGFGNPIELSKLYDIPIRLAQATQPPVSSGNPSLAPLKWVGMVINPMPTQKNPNLVDECTGQFIKPNVILTAGHCVNDLPDNPTGTGYDVTKQRFILQYQNGEGSQTFKTICAAASPQWKLPANYKTMSPDQQSLATRAAAQHDFAMILVDGTSPTGVMPYALDWKGKVSQAVRVGYASNILDGEIVQQALGIVFFANAIPMFPESPPNLVVHWQSITDLTSGTSGGAWITNFSTTEGANKNVLIAVTSFRNDNYPGAILAAYLTAAEFNPLLDFVSKGCKSNGTPVGSTAPPASSTGVPSMSVSPPAASSGVLPKGKDAR